MQQAEVGLTLTHDWSSFKGVSTDSPSSVSYTHVHGFTHSTDVTLKDVLCTVILYTAIRDYYE